MRNDAASHGGVIARNQCRNTGKQGSRRTLPARRVGDVAIRFFLPGRGECGLPRRCAPRNDKTDIVDSVNGPGHPTGAVCYGA